MARYPNDFAYSTAVIPERTLSDGTILPEIPASASDALGVQPYFLAEDASELFQFTADAVQPLGATANQQARNVGASQVSIIFDETEQAFQIAQAHTNIIIGANPIQEPAIQQIRVQSGTPAENNSFFGRNVTCDTYSGIFFTALEPESLWFDKMQLNKNLLTSIGANNHVIKDFSTSIDSDFNILPTAPQLVSVLCHPTHLAKGLNITGIFNGLDLLINKIAYPPKGTNPGDIAAASYPVQPQDFGQQIATDTLVGLTGLSMTSAIVGKFYSNGNFTQDESGGFAYVHQGEPITIRSLKVRILDSTGKPEAGLGPSSAFILKLTTDK